MSIAEKIKAIPKEILQKNDELNAYLDSIAVSEFYAKICKEDGVSYEEAIRLCQEDPKYSMGLKMCSPAVITMLQLPGGKEKFASWLTPEELEIFNSPEMPKNFRALVKKEKKKQRAKA